MSCSLEMLIRWGEQKSFCGSERGHWGPLLKGTLKMSRCPVAEWHGDTGWLWDTGVAQWDSGVGVGGISMGLSKSRAGKALPGLGVQTRAQH